MNYKKNILIIVFCLFVSGSVYAEDFVDMISPASSIGLGDTFAANSIGPDSVWLNPAGIAAGFVNQYSVGGGRWIDEVTLFLGSAIFPTSFGNFGAGVGWLGMGPEEYEDSHGLYTGENLNFNNILFSLGYGREVFNIPIGANFKFVQSSFAKDDKFLVLADFGFMYDFGDLNTGAEFI